MNWTEESSSILKTERNVLDVQIAAFSSNIVGLIVNITHMAIVWQLKSLRNTAHKTTLLSLAISDIILCFTRCVYYFPKFPYRAGTESCSTRKNIPTVIVIAMDYPTSLHCWVFLISAAIQFMALYHPLRFRQHRFITNLKKIMVAIFLLSVLVSFIEFFVINLIISTEEEFAHASFYGKIVTESLPSTAAVVLFIAVIIKLTKLQAQEVSKNMVKARKAAVYVVSVFLIFLLCLFIDVFLCVATIETRDIAFYEARNIIFAFFTITSTALYMFMSKEYRRMIGRRLRLCCLTERGRVRPISTVHFITVKSFDTSSTT